MAITLSNTYTSTYTLSDPATQNPATVSATGVIAVNSADAFSTGISGAAGIAWTIANFGIVKSLGSYGVGVSLESGGLITNGTAGSSPGYIGGSAIGIQINGASGNSAVIVNYGTVKSVSSYLFGNAIAIGGVAGTIVNSGSIISVNTGGAAANGIQLGAGGVVVNSGLIEAFSGGNDQAGIVSFSGLATVVNTGTIGTTGTSGTGVNIAAGAISNSGLITGARQGIAIGAGIVSNSGIISQTGALGSQAIDLGGAGGVGTLANIGIVTASGTSGNAVLVGLGGGTIVNGQAGTSLGLISAYHTGIGFFPGPSTAPGVLTIVNYGRIESTQPGVVAGNAFTVNSGVGSTTVVDNFGTIISAQTDGGGAILLDGGQITNRTGALIKAVGGNGISNSNTALTVTNFGTIVGGGVNGIGVVLAAGSTLTNAGTIIGESGTAVTFVGPSGNRLVIDPGGYFKGGIYGGNGTLDLAAGNGSTGTLTGLNGSITGFGSVVLDANAAWLVKIDNPGGFTATVSGLTVDDGLVLAATGFDPNGTASLLPGNLLQITENFATYTVALDPDRSYAGVGFELSSDLAGGTLVSMTIRQLAPRDFDASGTSDVLWRDAGGLVAIWEMNGAAASASGIAGSADSSWRISGTGDFNGDTMADILWRHDTDGVAIWQMNGLTPIAIGAAGFADPSWQIRTTGDFNGDGLSDILWRHDSGSVAIWEMNGATVIGSGGAGFADPSWQIGGAGDFNGDGLSDILWRHDSGSVHIWEMNGLTPIATGEAGFADPGWHIRGAGDFGGDGRSDILWQHDSGSVYLWQMDGASIIENGEVGFADPSWRIGGVADFNGDRRSDILWRHEGGGVSVWEMNGASVIGIGDAGFADPSWGIVPPDNTGATQTPISAAPSTLGFSFSDISSPILPAGDTGLLPALEDSGGDAVPLISAGTPMPVADAALLPFAPFG